MRGDEEGQIKTLALPLNESNYAPRSARPRHGAVKTTFK